MLMNRSAIEAVGAVIREYVRWTSVIELDGRDIGLGDCHLVFKLEFLQRTGSFKARGAFVNLLMRSVPEAGVLAASGGNHGAAVAHAAARLGVAATIFVPRVSAPTKVERIRSYGAKVQIVGETYGDAFAASQAEASDSKKLYVHAFDQLETVLGQGTVALELERQAPRMDALLVPVGGGGLLGGIALWYGRAIRVVGVEPRTAPSLQCAFRAGRPVDTETGGVAADSLGAARVGDLPYELIRSTVDDVLLVDDDAILAAQAKLWELLRVRVEAAAAVGFAALLAGAYVPRRNETVGLILSGANAA